MPQKNLIEKLIERKLGGYYQQINSVDKNLPVALDRKRSVAIIGAGLAGLAAATILAERGFKVHIYEKDSFIGGKVGSWPHTFPDGFDCNIEHGFHAFFRQYYNLRRLLEKIDVSKNLTPISDYLIMTLDQGSYSCNKINTTPLLNLLSLMRTKVYTLGEVLRNPKFNRMSALLQYDPQKTFSKYDNASFKDFAEQVGLNNQMRLMFTSFARAFFAEPGLISMAELIKSFHFYFLSNDHGLIYDVLNDDFEVSLLNPMRQYLNNYDVSIFLNNAVTNLAMENTQFIIENKKYDYLILASDIKGTQKIVANSTFFNEAYPSFSAQIKAQKISQKYAVLRIWINRDIDPELPFFIFTDALEILDSVTTYHRMEKSSQEWVAKNGGGIFELHSYALPEKFNDPKQIRSQFLLEFDSYFPGLKGYQIKYDYLQVRDDFTAFHTNLYANRPTFKSEIPNCYLAGDWVKIPCPAMLMEAAATSALYSANEILMKENLSQEPIFSVPLRGIFA
jgi:isorenieratene synthase